ncbi:MAG: Hsp70 family protein, partial [Chloroflexota bacterium]
DIHVLQGERPMAADNMSLGNFQLQGIAPAPRGTPQIEVTFDIDANGIINVTATDKATGKAQKITVTASTNLKQGEIDKLVREADQHRAEDERAHELEQARNEADSLVYQAEKALSNLSGKLSDSDRSAIEQQIKAVHDANAKNDVNSIREATQNLQNATYALSQQMYNDQSAANGGSNPNAGQERGEDVVEGDFSEA